MAELSDENAAERAQAETAYRTSMDHAQSLPSVNPIKLGLHLNFSVFYYEIMNDPEEAFKIARKALDGAVAGLDSATEESVRDAGPVVQLLRDNLALWASEGANGTVLKQEAKKEETEEN